ncbi:uncharacterized protein VTP21DRAFT_5422 [Calcarisporiella thermophila]|uniref:uncharacterized protein n=1 Tax=Calcarisporiella thermophila TaxID=911321 RepID=UPI00374216FF
MAGEGMSIEDVIGLEELDLNLFRSRTLYVPPFAQGVFGGQVVSHSLYAAYKTVDEEFSAHSLHCYFIYPATNATPILYDVERVRDGKTYATRVVKARQNGRSVFILACSFSKREKTEFSHQYTMPKVPPPEEIMSETERYQLVLKDPRCNRAIRSVIQSYLDLPPKPIEFRHILTFPEEGYLIPPEKTNRRTAWFRANGNLRDDPRLHHCILAYASDEAFITTSGLPLGIAYNTDPYYSMLVSLDHTVYFHEEFRADEWLLFDMETPRLNNARGLVLGRIYRQDGVLVASVVQEGVVRINHRKKKKTQPQESKL